MDEGKFCLVTISCVSYSIVSWKMGAPSGFKHRCRRQTTLAPDPIISLSRVATAAMLAAGDSDGLLEEEGE